MDIENWSFKKFCKFCFVVFIPLLIPVIITGYLIAFIPVVWLQIILSIVVAILISYVYIKYWVYRQIINNDKLDDWISK